QVVNLALARREATGGRPRARDVGRVIAVFRPDVHDDQITVFNLFAVTVVMQHGRIDPRPDDRGEARAFGAVAQEGGQNVAFEFVFINAGPQRARHAGLRGP